MNRLGSALLLLLVLAIPCSAAMGLAEATGQRIARVEVENPTRVRTSEILSLSLLRPGDAYDPEKVQRGLALLAQKVEIRNVWVTAESSPDGLDLTLLVTPEPLVRSIKIRGNRALRNADIRGRLTTRIDLPVHETTLAKDVRAIRELYDAEGYPEVRVEPRVEVVDSPQWVRVVFFVAEGSYWPIRRVELTEGAPMDQGRILAILGLHLGGPASRRQLREETRRLVELLWREGYPEARLPRPHFEPGDGGAVLVLPLRAGEPLDVRVEGMDEWAARPLREIAKGRYGETIDEAWARQVAERMEEHLKGEGYAKAQVRWEFGFQYGRTRLTFQVNRGQRVRVERVIFQDNEHLSSKTLRSYMSLVEGGIVRPPPFTEEALQRDLQVLQDYAASQGFLDARVTVVDLDTSAGDDAVLTLQVDEGHRYHFGTISIECNETLEDSVLLSAAGLEEGSPSDPGALDQARLRILRELESQGYPDAEVRYRTTVDSERAVMDVVFCIDPGMQVRFGKVVVSGNVRTHTKVIRRELTFQEGELWDPQKVTESRRRLYSLGFFRRVRIEPAPQFTPSKERPVRVAVEEQDAGSISFGFGYATEEKFKVSGSVAHANLFGSGRSLELRADYDSLEHSYAVNFREPWLFNHPYDLRLSLVSSYQDQEAYNLSSVGFQAALERAFSDEFKGSLLYTLESNDLSDVAPDAELSDLDVGTYLLSSFGPVLVWDSRDDRFNPKSGFYNNFQAEWASEFLGSEVTYGRYLGTASTFLTAWDVTLALLARGGLALEYTRTADLPVNKRFFLGGRNTVRGFKLDEIGPKAEDGSPIGGDVMVNLKAELRIPVWKELGLALFWDSGNVWNRSVESPDYQNLRHGAGFGLRYVTPVGPISVDIGWKVDRKSGEDPYVVNFTVGNVF